MRLDREKAFSLRRQGKSYKEISAQLGMSGATLSLWFKNEPWSNEIKSRLSVVASTKNPEKMALMRQIRQKKVLDLYHRAHEEASADYAKLSIHPLFIAGLMIYWGEGDKLSKYRCSIANTEAKIVEIYLRFLTEVCRVDKERIRAWILLYPDLNDKTCQDYWRENAGLQNYKFSKSIVIQGRSKVRRLSYGVCNVAFHNRYFKEKMITWLKLASYDLTTGRTAGMV